MTDELNEGTEITVSTEREHIKQLLLKAGMLVTDIEIPEQYNIEVSEDILPIVLPPNSKSWTDSVDEDRGEY